MMEVFDYSHLQWIFNSSSVTTDRCWGTESRPNQGAATSPNLLGISSGPQVNGTLGLNPGPLVWETSQQSPAPVLNLSGRRMMGD